MYVLLLQVIPLHQYCMNAAIISSKKHKSLSISKTAATLLKIATYRMKRRQCLWERHLPIDHETPLVPELSPVPEEGRVAHLAAVRRLPGRRHLALNVQLPEDEQAFVSRWHELLWRRAYVQRLRPPSAQ